MIGKSESVKFYQSSSASSYCQDGLPGVLRGREVTVNIINARDEKRREAEGAQTKTDTACMILFSFFYGCKLSTEEGRHR